MKRTIQVFVGDEPRRVGTLHYDAVGSRERSAFAYEETWLGAVERFALEPALTPRPTLRNFGDGSLTLS